MIFYWNMQTPPKSHFSIQYNLDNSIKKILFLKKSLLFWQKLLQTDPRPLWHWILAAIFFSVGRACVQNAASWLQQTHPLNFIPEMCQAGSRSVGRQRAKQETPKRVNNLLVYLKLPFHKNRLVWLLVEWRGLNGCIFACTKRGTCISTSKRSVAKGSYFLNNASLTKISNY